MRAAWLLSAILVAGCYDPAVRDCTITCRGAGDCAGGQVCGADGFCAAPDVAGTCRASGGGDAHPASPDAIRAQLHLTIQGPGTIADADGKFVCTTPPGDCTFDATPGISVTFVATPLDGKDFDRWTTASCAGNDAQQQGATCTVLIAAPTTTVGARFK